MDGTLINSDQSVGRDSEVVRLIGQLLQRLQLGETLYIHCAGGTVIGAAISHMWKDMDVQALLQLAFLVLATI